MIRALRVITLLMSLAGCAGATLPYKPEQQPSGARVSAAYQLVGDRLRIEIDTNHRRLEEAKIVKPDGTEVRAQAIDNAPTVAGSPVGVGIGVGGGSWGRGGVGVGTGVSVGVPVGGTASSIEGNTFAWFPIEQAGPRPWRLYVKLVGIEPTVILVGSAPSGSR